MEINALMMDLTDNVVTCVREVSAGEEVLTRAPRSSSTAS